MTLKLRLYFLKAVMQSTSCLSLTNHANFTLSRERVEQVTLGGVEADEPIEDGKILICEGYSTKEIRFPSYRR